MGRGNSSEMSPSFPKLFGDHWKKSRKTQSCSLCQAPQEQLCPRAVS